MIGLANVRLTVLIREEEGVYVSKCQELEVASCGDTPEEALDNIREAIELYLENARETGILQDLEPILTSRYTFTSVNRCQGMTKLPPVSSDEIVRKLKTIGFDHAPAATLPDNQDNSPPGCPISSSFSRPAPNL